VVIPSSGSRLLAHNAEVAKVRFNVGFQGADSADQHQLLRTGSGVRQVTFHITNDGLTAVNGHPKA